MHLSVREAFHHYGRQLAESRDLARDDILEALCEPMELDFESKEGGRFGLVTSTFNQTVRERLHATGRWRSEVSVVDDFGPPLFRFDPRDRAKPGGQTGDRFDLAVIDEHANAQQMWNVLTRWHELPTHLQDESLAAIEGHLRAHWGELEGDCDCLYDAVSRAWPPGLKPLEDFLWRGKVTEGSLRKLAAASKELPRVAAPELEGVLLGEVQLGNWGLAYRDVGRVLATREKLPEGAFELFIVVALDGCFAGFISEGTVRFTEVERVLKRLGRQLTVPTWLIGVDFNHAPAAPNHPSTVATGS